MVVSEEVNHETIGVVLLNLGGPQRIEDVRPFLYNLFSDRLIIRLGPGFMQKPLAWWIATRRAPKSQGYYRSIGGGSPLNSITADQGRALASQLAPHGSFQVVMVMRYWHPFVQEVLPALTKSGISKIVALTLYPQYSIATTGSSMVDLRNYVAKMPEPMEIVEIEAWPDKCEYVSCLVQRIREAGGIEPGTEVVYSAHSLPAKFIAEGDPYLEHLQRTIKAVEQQTGVSGHLCFQSRSGPVEWLTPSTPETINVLAGKGCRKIVMVPISFVSDHVETLCEIDIQYRQLAAGLGVELVRTASLNVDPNFINCLKELVVSASQSKGWL